MNNKKIIRQYIDEGKMQWPWHYGEDNEFFNSLTPEQQENARNVWLNSWDASRRATAVAWSDIGKEIEGLIKPVCDAMLVVMKKLGLVEKDDE